MKELLEKWATLEPYLCKRETRPNKDWHEEFEDYLLFSTETKAWYLVYSDSFIENYSLDKEGMLMKVQWAVQQAIVEKGWHFKLMNYPGNPITFFAKVENRDYGYSLEDSSLTKALLIPYIKMLEANANP